MIDQKSPMIPNVLQTTSAIRRVASISLICIPFVLAGPFASFAQETQSDQSEPVIEAPQESGDVEANEEGEASDGDENAGTETSEGAGEPETQATESAEEAMPEVDIARFQLEKNGDQYVRMNLKTGQMSICNIRGANLVCKMAADDRAVLEEEIAELQSDRDEERNPEKKDKEHNKTRNSTKSKDGHENDSRENSEGEDGESQKPKDGLKKDKDNEGKERETGKLSEDEKDRETAKSHEGKDRDKRRDQKDEYLDSEIDKALEYSARAMRKFFDVMRELRDDLNK